MKDGTIYLVENAINGKRYVGKTHQNPTTRWRAHCSEAKHGSPLYLHRAIRKYGEAAFTVSTLATGLSAVEAVAMEIWWVTAFSTFTSRGAGYNMTRGGEGTTGYVSTPETLAKINATNLSKKLGMSTLSVHQAASLLQMSPLTLRKKAASGKVPAYKIFKSWVFLYDELLTFIKNSKLCPYIDAQALRTSGSVSGLRVVKSGSQLAQAIAAKRKSLKLTREPACGDRLN
jgi:hypothetical protein